MEEIWLRLAWKVRLELSLINSFVALIFQHSFFELFLSVERPPSSCQLIHGQITVGAESFLRSLRRRLKFNSINFITINKSFERTNGLQVTILTARDTI